MLEVKDVSLKLDNKKILSDINLNIEKGKIYGLIGPNGVGKTSLIKCLVGIYKTNTGSILYNNEEVYNNPAVKKKIAYVSDENNYFLSFKVKDIIKFYSSCYGGFDYKKFYKLNKIFKVPEDKNLFQLSKGNKMRVAILIALCIENVEYIILDEPTSGLDPVLKNKLLKIFINEIATRSISIVISSHYLSELEKICDKVVIIKNGTIDYVNSLDDMREKIKKVQVAFDSPVYEEDLKFDGVYSIKKVGRVFTIITENYGKEFLDNLNNFNPLFIEEIDLSLEDVLISKVDEEDDYEEIL